MAAASACLKLPAYTSLHMLKVNPSPVSPSPPNCYSRGICSREQHCTGSIKVSMITLVNDLSLVIKPKGEFTFNVKELMATVPCYDETFPENLTYDSRVSKTYYAPASFSCSTMKGRTSPQRRCLATPQSCGRERACRACALCVGLKSRVRHELAARQARLRKI